MRVLANLALIVFFGVGCAHGPRADVQTLGAAPPAPSVSAVRESAAIGVAGDAADDPAIWVAPVAAESIVIATQKKGGLFVFDLAGAVVQSLPGGRPNNVDLRDGFAWGDGVDPIVIASDRSDNAIATWRLESATRRLHPAPAGRIATGFAEVYGICAGRHGGDIVAVATSKLGEVGAWKLKRDDAGVVSGERMWRIGLGAAAPASIAEGCAIDDATGVIYLAQELVGLWRIPLSAPDGRRLIDRVGDGRLVADVEGVSLYARPDGGGYVVASVQGANRFAVYDRAGDNAFRGAFSIAASADGAVDGVTGTDGLDIASAPLGPDFPSGLIVVQDDVNTAPTATQNFKYVSWAQVATALGLE